MLIVSGILDVDRLPAGARQITQNYSTRLVLQRKFWKLSGSTNDAKMKRPSHLFNDYGWVSIRSSCRHLDTSSGQLHFRGIASVDIVGFRACRQERVELGQNQRQPGGACLIRLCRVEPAVTCD